MELAVLVLKSGEKIVSLLDHLDMEPRVHCTSPYLIGGKTKVTLTPWLGECTKEQHILIHSDSLLTVVEPLESIRDAYLAKIGKTLEDITPKESEQVLLQENEEAPSLAENELDDEDDVNYIEEPGW